MARPVAMRVFFGFFRGLATLARPWWIWIAALILVNGLVPLLFLRTIEARVVLLSFLLAAGIQMAIFSRLGFVRLLGAGHLTFWIPMLVWLWPRALAAGAASGFGKWLWAVVILDVAASLIDAVDVVRYVLGDRRPSLTMEEVP